MFKRNAKVLVVLVLMLAAVVVFAGCGKKDENSNAGGSKVSGKVDASGSTALLPLVTAAKENFEAQNSAVTVNVAGGGSFNGLKQVSEGAVTIGNSDVDVSKAKDVKDADKMVDHKVAVAPFEIVVNSSVTVDSLTQDQLIQIFNGKITNWKEVGGPDLAITVVHRPASSGSRAVIKEVVMKGVEFPVLGVQQDSSGAVKQALEQTKGAIGYLDAAYVKKEDTKMKGLKYNGVEYTPDNVYNGKYPIWSFEHMYTKGEATGAAKAFIDYILSADFQNNYLDKTGFLPVAKMK